MSGHDGHEEHEGPTQEEQAALYRLFSAERRSAIHRDWAERAVRLGAGTTGETLAFIEQRETSGLDSDGRARVVSFLRNISEGVALPTTTVVAVVREALIQRELREREANRRFVPQGATPLFLDRTTGESVTAREREYLGLVALRERRATSNPEFVLEGPRTRPNEDPIPDAPLDGTWTLPEAQA